MRLLGFLAWALLVAALLIPVLISARRARRRVGGEELVKDPVCQTYVLRSRAVVGRGAGEPVYFCSAECARRYATPFGG